MLTWRRIDDYGAETGSPSLAKFNNERDNPDGDGVLVTVRRGKTNQEGEVRDVRFVKGGVARAIRTLQNAASPVPDDQRPPSVGRADRTGADAITAAVREAADHGDHVTPDQFTAGLAELEARLTWWFAGAMLAQTGVILAAVIGAAVAILRMLG